jgi:hypothetical protein
MHSARASPGKVSIWLPSERKSEKPHSMRSSKSSHDGRTTSMLSPGTKPGRVVRGVRAAAADDAAAHAGAATAAVAPPDSSAAAAAADAGEEDAGVADGDVAVAATAAGEHAVCGAAAASTAVVAAGAASAVTGVAMAPLSASSVSSSTRSAWPGNSHDTTSASMDGARVAACRYCCIVSRRCSMTRAVFFAVITSGDRSAGHAGNMPGGMTRRSCASSRHTSLYRRSVVVVRLLVTACTCSVTQRQREHQRQLPPTR